MLMYGWMKFVEIAPERYDWAVKLMTVGRLDRLKDRIAEMIQRGDRVLDVGCGTGTLAMRCLRRGAYVTGLDISEHMLSVAHKNAEREGLADRLTLIKDSITQLHKHASPMSYDYILCTMVLGEFSTEYLQYVFKECFDLLRPKGRLLIADEVRPENLFARAVYQIMLAIAWIPQFLLLRRVTYPVVNLKQRIEEAGFNITCSESWFLTSFNLIAAEKPERASTVPADTCIAKRCKWHSRRGK